MKAHKTAIVSSKANVAEGVEIGPYSVVEDGVTIGPGSRLSAYVYIHKGTTIGTECKMHTGVVLGDEPQDMAFKGGETFLEIGDRNVFREHVTIHRGTDEGSSTVVGNDCYFMALSHAAHNCAIGNNVIICNNTMLAGHVKVDDKAFISASCLIHQFARVGTIAMMAGGVRINRDLPPYMVAENDNMVGSFNIVGLKRAGFSSEARSAIKQAYNLLYRSDLNLSNALSEIEKSNPCEEVKDLLEFIKSAKRGICFSRSNRASKE